MHRVGGCGGGHEVRKVEEIVGGRVDNEHQFGTGEGPVYYTDENRWGTRGTTDTVKSRGGPRGPGP